MSDDHPTASDGMPGPAPEHERLRPFAGTFRAEVRIWMGPGDPLVMKGTMENTLDLGGLFLRQVYTGDDVEGPFPAFEGRGFWGFNTVTGRYEGFWVDNASSVMQTESGEVDESGKVWTLRGEIPDPKTGDTLRRRTVITLHDPDHHTMESYFDREGGEQKAMEIDYERAG
ncbi:MAG: DUF1579 domain-containing protein [Thermoanaerobaculia bacterium]|nr:DUF1579 domain-containing protein [Thermoanaerobaculia bacterium]